MMRSFHLAIGFGKSQLLGTSLSGPAKACMSVQIPF